MKLAFLLAELITRLSTSADHQQDLQELNRRFNQFRRGDPDTLVESGAGLADYLESLTERHPDLVPRIADFQSLIQENIRWRQRVAGGGSPL